MGLHGQKCSADITGFAAVATRIVTREGEGKFGKMASRRKSGEAGAVRLPNR